MTHTTGEEQMGERGARRIGPAVVRHRPPAAAGTSSARPRAVKEIDRILRMVHFLTAPSKVRLLKNRPACAVPAGSPSTTVDVQMMALERTPSAICASIDSRWVGAAARCSFDSPSTPGSHAGQPCLSNRRAAVRGIRARGARRCVSSSTVRRAPDATPLSIDRSRADDSSGDRDRGPSDHYS